MPLKWTISALFLITSCATTLGGDVVNQTQGQDATKPPAQECSSCTARHQDMLKKKKQREKKAQDAEAAAKAKSAE